MVDFLCLGRALIVSSMIICASVASAKAKEIPMWEGFEKNELHKAADEEFIKGITESTGGDLNAGAKRAVQLGWKAIEAGDVEKAIRRFNQAWLLYPERGDIYWGYAIATGIRGDDLKTVERWFAKAETIVGRDWRLLADWGLILHQRGQHQRAIPFFLESIEANPENPSPHIGMVNASKELGDDQTARKHMKILRSLKD